jgi:hypothetical protein
VTDSVFSQRLIPHFVVGKKNVMEKVTLATHRQVHGSEGNNEPNASKSKEKC